MKTVWKPALIFALFAAAVAASLVDAEGLLTVALLAASIGGALAAVIWPKKPGTQGGMLVVVLAYPVTWLACLFGAVAEHGSGGSIGLWAIAYTMYATISFVLTGWVTIPAGAFIGYLLNRRSSTIGGKPTASPWVPSQTHGCI